MKLLKKTKFQKDGKIIKKYKLFGVSVLRKEILPFKRKWNLLGIKFCRKNKKWKGLEISEIDISSSNDGNLPKIRYSLLDVIKNIDFQGKDNYKKDDYSVTVLIPVYNGVNHLKNLIPSLLENTHKKAKIVIINDNSPDENVDKYLEKLKDYKQIKILKNSRNKGFVATVNYGMSLISTKYAVWLNSDVVVPKFWIERLLFAFDNDDKIATITPFTNSGVLFSFPNFGENNELKFSLSDVDNAFKYVSDTNIELNTVYSGTGFCMAVNMEAWHSVGDLDEENFGKGYGEENDWCFRAKRMGWKHLLAPNLFVAHHHGGSFLPGEKIKLCEEHAKILRQKYKKEMTKDVPEFFSTDPWSVYRYAASLMLCKDKPILVIDLKKQSTDKSGAIDYRNRLVENLENEGYKVIVLQYERFKKNCWSISPVTVCENIDIALDSISDLMLLFTFLDIKQVVINNLAFCEDVENVINVLGYVKDIYSPIFTYKFHDYLSLCPSFFLINKEGKNCQNYINCLNSRGCLLNSRYRTIKRVDVDCWRKMWHKLFLNIDEFDLFSEYSYNIISKVYPEIIEKSKIVEHAPLLSIKHSLYVRPKSDKNLTIAFVGNFVKEKGADDFVELSKIFEKEKINANFVIIGMENTSIKHCGVKYLQGYHRNELGDILSKNNVHAVVYPSINNEVFSYVAQELMLLKVPLVVYKNGAPSERIKKYNYQYGEIAEDMSPNSLGLALKKLLVKVYSSKF